MMKRILINFIREQKKYILQFYGLAALTIIMISSFLTLTFASNYVTKQYFTDIAKGQLHQDTAFYLNPTFRLNKEIVNKKTLFENMVVYEGTNAKDAQIKAEKFYQNTWKLEKLEDKNGNKKGLYRFHFGSLDNEEKKVQPRVGQSLTAKTNKTFLDFKISIPITYPTLKDHDNEVNRIKKIFDKYADGKKLNYFIFDDNTLEYFQKNIQADTQLNPDKVVYGKEDINNHALLYQSIITGALYSTNNLSWRRDLKHEDVLFSNKIIHFIQYTPGEIYNYPIVTGATPDLGNNPLEDDEILVYEAFAAKNNLVVGSPFFYSGKWYKIRGFATSILAAAPNNYFGSAIDFKNQTIGFVNKNTFDKIGKDPLLSKKNNGYFYGINPDLGSISPEYNNYWLYQYLHESIDPSLDLIKKKLCLNAIDIVTLLNPLKNWISDSNYNQITEVSTWSAIEKQKKFLTKIGYTFLNIIFIIVCVITLIVITKMIERNKAAIGILKANGYRNHNISLMICLAIIIPSIIFALIGIISAIFISHIIINSYKMNLALINYGWAFEFGPVLLALVIPVVTLWIISFASISYLLKKKPIALIDSRSLQTFSNFKWIKNKQYLKLTKNMSYRNKIALTLMKRNFIKNIFLMVTSFFASTLLFFTFSATGMINNLIANNYRNINYNYENIYTIPPENKFINEKGEKIYEKMSITDIKKPAKSEKNPLLIFLNDAVDDIIAKKLSPTLSFDFRNHYLMGKDLAALYQKIEKSNIDNSNLLAKSKNNGNKTKVYFDYFTKNENLMITFGLMPYDEKQENPIIKLSKIETWLWKWQILKNEKRLDISDKNLTYPGGVRDLIGINDKTSNYLSINLQQSNINTFSNLTLDEIKKNSSDPLNKRFLEKYYHFEKLNYSAYGKRVPIIPIIKSKDPFWFDRKVDNNDYLLFDVTTINNEQKYIFGLTYDISNDILAHEILLPQTWFANIISPEKQQTIPNFSNTKLSKLKSHELKNYLPIINLNNDYNINILQLLTDPDFFSNQKFIPAIADIKDIAMMKQIYNNLYGNIKLIILLFSTFSLILCFVIIIIISNININDNLGLILTLKSLGYKNNEITYLLTIFTVPILLFSATFSIYTISIFAENLAKIVSAMIERYAIIIFYWWYIILTFAVILTIYFASYIITWKTIIKKNMLTTLTK